MGVPVCDPELDFLQLSYSAKVSNTAGTSAFVALRRKAPAILSATETRCRVPAFSYLEAEPNSEPAVTIQSLAQACALFAG